MSKVGLSRASLYAIVEESVPGEYEKPTLGKHFIPLRPGNELAYEPETLENDELLNDIGASKAFIGKENLSGKHAAYLKHSGVEGQEPQIGVLYKSIMGDKQIASVEATLAAGSTTKVLKLAAGEGAAQWIGKALLIKDGVNGFSIRNINGISGDDITLNFELAVAPAAGVKCGLAVSYKPAAQGHPVFSTTKFLGNGFAKECAANNTVTEFSLTAEANGFGEVEFSFGGTKYYFNPVEITALNKFLDIVIDGTTYALSVPQKLYKTPIELADALQAAASAVIATETVTVSYNNQTGKYAIACSTATTMDLPLATGTNAANSIATTIGFTATDKSGALSYTGENELSYDNAITPAYDNADAIVMKGGELLIGTAADKLKVSSQSVKLSVKKDTEDVDDICEETGILEKIATTRVAELQVTATLKKHDVALLNALLKNSGISCAFNAGPRSGGNWTPGKCFNIYLQSCTVSKYTTTGDSFIQVDLTLKGFVTSSTKDIYLNFV